MADINVERKRSGGPNFLPWLLGLLLLGALIWGLSRLLGRDDEAGTAVPADTMVTTTTTDPAETGARDSRPEGAAGNP